MQRISLTIGSVAVAAGLLVANVPGALAATGDLSGRWNSVTLRQNGMGYSLRLTAADQNPTDAYDGVLRFHYQDGRLGRKVKVGVAVDGAKVTMVLPGGSLADGTRTLTARIGEDGSFTFAKCQTLLQYVTRRSAPEMCMFQQLPVS